MQNIREEVNRLRNGKHTDKPRNIKVAYTEIHCTGQLDLNWRFKKKKRN